MKRSACSHWRQAIAAEVGATLDPIEHAGLRDHLASCEACREFKRDLEADTAALRQLGSMTVTASPQLRQRWTTAICREPETAWDPFRLMRQLADLCRRNWKPLAVLSPAWLLILFLRLTAPDIHRQSRTIPAFSPVHAMVTLRLHEHLLTPRNEHL